MPTYESTITCPKCGGDGEIDVNIPAIAPDPNVPNDSGTPAKDITDECRLCKGTGWLIDNYYEGATEVDELKTKLDKTKDKCNAIKDKVDQIWAKVKDL